MGASMENKFGIFGKNQCLKFADDDEWKSQKDA
jgi:hypothetical protein